MDATAPLLHDHDRRQSSAERAALESMDNMRLNGAALRFYGQLFGTLLSFYISGLEMSAIGVLLPEFQDQYALSDSSAASIFIAAVLGYLLATVVTDTISTRHGFRGIAWIAPTTRMFATLLLFLGPPFELLLTGLFLFGLGTGVSDVGWNSWAAQVRRANVVQGLLHGAFAFGAVSGPVLAEAKVKEHVWTELFGVLAIMSVIELLLQSWAFRFSTASSTKTLTDSLDDEPRGSLFKSRAAWLCCAFGFVYNSAEASLTNWIVEYMLRFLDADIPRAAMASSLFWTGMGIGRVALGPITEYLGLRSSVTVYILAAVVLQILLMVNRSIKAVLAVLAFNGLFFGPLFPSVVTLLSRRVPENQRVKGIASIIALAQVGAAAGPGLVGVLAQTVAISHLTSLTLGLSIASLVIWRLI